MALLFCPLIHGECQNEKCAGWDSVMGQCFVLSLLDQLIDINRQLALIRQCFLNYKAPFEPCDD